MDWKKWIIEKIADLIWNCLNNRNHPNVMDDTSRKKIVDVIKSEESRNTILIKSKICDFNSKSVLIVMPGEEALFVDNGKIVKKFNEGRYTLSTSNYPFLSDLITVVSGKRIFSSDIYFIRKAVSNPMDWGTSIVVRDPKQLISTRIMCRGVYRVQITNSKAFLSYYIGNGSEKLEQYEFAQTLKDEILQKIKSEITDYILDNNQEIIGISCQQNFLAEKIGEIIKDTYEIYGFKIVSFTIAGMDILNDDRREKIEEAYSRKRVSEILGFGDSKDINS